MRVFHKYDLTAIIYTFSAKWIDNELKITFENNLFLIP